MPWRNRTTAEQMAGGSSASDHAPFMGSQPNSSRYARCEEAMEREQTYHATKSQKADVSRLAYAISAHSVHSLLIVFLLVSGGYAVRQRGPAWISIHKPIYV